jgi:hypothetical protein
VGFPFLCAVRFPSRRIPAGIDLFRSHKRGHWFNPYSAHHHKQLSAFAESIGLILPMIGLPMIAPKKSTLVVYGTPAQCVGE